MKNEEKIKTVRLSPGDCCFTAEFLSDEKADKVYLEVFPVGEEEKKRCFSVIPDGLQGSFYVDGILNKKDYVLRIYMEKHGKLFFGRDRFIRCGAFPGVVINYLHPDDKAYISSGRFIASPSLLKLGDGRLLASHDIFSPGGGQNITLVFSSEDNGKSWKYLSEIRPCFWGKLFMHENRVFMLGESTEYGDLEIFSSDDRGKSWSAPTAIMKGGSSEKGGPHKAPNPVTEYSGRLWAALDYGSWSTGGHASGAVSADITKDIMEKESWKCTGFINTPEGNTGKTLEGNIIKGKDGELYNILRYQNTSDSSPVGKAVMLKLDKNNPERKPEFYRFIDFPGNLSKFSVYYDSKTDLYFSLVNRVTGKNIFMRNVLSLIYSENLTEWKIKRDVLNFEYEDSEKTGFQYADFVFDNDDILFISRTALNGADNFHNSNCITFHRINDYML